MLPVAAAFLLAVMPALAQLTRGTISGIVLDPSGARVRAARVALMSPQNAGRRETTTNAMGIYRITAIEPGEYSIEIQADGFKLLRMPTVRMQSSSEMILNHTLSLRDETTTVEVVAEVGSSSILGASGGGSNYFGLESLEGLPYANVQRDPQPLALLFPLSARGPSFSGISAGGQRTRNQNFLLDGTDNNEVTITGSALRMIPEELAELKVQFPTLSAEFGHNTGSQISVITRSGTNQLHFSVWDYLRSNRMDSITLPDKRAGFERTPSFIHNQAGGSVGGPVKKDKTFFYLVLEANRRRESPNTRNASTITIPSPAGYLALSSVPLGPGQTAASRQKTIEGLSFLPSVYQELGSVRQPTIRTVNGVPIEFDTVRVPISSPSNLWHGMARLDHTLNSSGTLSYRVLVDKRMQYNASSNQQFASRFAASSDILNQSHTASITYSLGASWMLESRVSFVRNALDFPENDPDSPTVQILGAFTFGGFSTFPQSRTARLFQWQQAYNYSSGRHLVKFGADLRRSLLLNISQFDLKGSWTFNNFTDYLNSQPSRLRHLLTDSSYNAAQTSQAYFIQDNVQLSRDWSLDIGARYELPGVPLGYFGTSDPALQQVGVPGPARPDRNNLAPRLGVAYAPSTSRPWARLLLGDGETVFRASYSMQHDVIYLNVLTVVSGNYPRALKYDVFPPDSGNLFPTLLPRPSVLPAFDPVRFPFANVPQDIQNPTSRQWLMEIQRSFGTRQFVEIGYMGTHSYHLLRQSERNPGLLTMSQAEASIAGSPIPGLQERRLNPAWASRATVESTALSTYHGLYLRHHQEVIPGLRSDLSFTWSGAFSDNDEPLAIADISSSSPSVPQNVFDYRSEWSRSVFDRPLRLTAVYTYDLFSAFRHWRWNPVATAMLSGWKTSGSFEWQSGQPFTVVTGVDSGGSGLMGWRPNLRASGTLLPDPNTGDLRTFQDDQRFETPRNSSGLPLANSMPTGGNLGRNTFSGPGFFLWNVNFSKTTVLRDNLKLQLRADFINFLRHRNFGNPVSNMNNASFGQNTSDPGTRSVIASAKIIF